MSNRMRKLGDIVATVGTYNDRQTGQEKKRYMKCGILFQREDGSYSIKMDGVPITKEWSGWMAVFDQNRQNQPPTGYASNHQEFEAQRHGGGPPGFGNDNVPSNAPAGMGGGQQSFVPDDNDFEDDIPF